MAEKNAKASKAQIIEDEVNFENSENESTTSNEVKKEKIEIVPDVKLKRELYEKGKELEEKDEEILKLKKQLGEKKQEEKSPDFNVIEQMQAQINQLSRQVITGAKGDKLLFRQPAANDLLPQGESVTFTARSVFYVVASYIDSRGIEQLPPHKLIIFTYQASDIRKDGKEETIKNFCQFTTNLKTEVDFLRKHPYYGITFSENVNEMMEEDVRDTQFKVRAANQLSTLPPELILERAREGKFPNWQNKSIEELRYQIANQMAEDFKKESQSLQEDILRRRIIAQNLVNEKNSKA